MHGMPAFFGRPTPGFLSREDAYAINRALQELSRLLRLACSASMSMGLDFGSTDFAEIRPGPLAREAARELDRAMLATQLLRDGLRRAAAASGLMVHDSASGLLATCGEGESPQPAPRVFIEEDIETITRTIVLGSTTPLGKGRLEEDAEESRRSSLMLADSPPAPSRRLRQEEDEERYIRSFLAASSADQAITRRTLGEEETERIVTRKQPRPVSFVLDLTATYSPLLAGGQVIPTFSLPTDNSGAPFAPTVIGSVSSSINSSVTSMSLTNFAAFPANLPFYVQCESEVMQVTAGGSAGATQTISRHALSTPAASHAAGTPVVLRSFLTDTFTFSSLVAGRYFVGLELICAAHYPYESGELGFITLMEDIDASATVAYFSGDGYPIGPCLLWLGSPGGEILHATSGFGVGGFDFDQLTFTRGADGTTPAPQSFGTIWYVLYDGQEVYGRLTAGISDTDTTVPCVVFGGSNFQNPITIDVNEGMRVIADWNSSALTVVRGLPVPFGPGVPHLTGETVKVGSWGELETGSKYLVLEYSKNGGAWTELGRTETGAPNLSVLLQGWAIEDFATGDTLRFRASNYYDVTYFTSLTFNLYLSKVI